MRTKKTKNEEERSGFKARLRSFATEKGLSMNKFEIACGLTAGYIRTCTGNVSDLTKKLITNSFPELNWKWLETGEGSMYREGVEPTTININNIKGSNVAGRDQYVGVDKATMRDELTALKAENKALRERLEAQESLLNKLVTMLGRIKDGL